jgi:membrane-associated phospholipid phosphatase
MFLLLVDWLLDSLVHFYFATLIFALLYLLKRKNAARNLAFLLCSGMVVNYILKQIVQIPLTEVVPMKFTSTEWLAIRAVNYSMPSAHASHLFVLFFVYIFEFNVIFDRLRYRVIALVFGFLCLVKCFTIYILGFHFLEDILVGFLLSALECIY